MIEALTVVASVIALKSSFCRLAVLPCFSILSTTYFKALFQGVVIQINDGRKSEKCIKVHITPLSRLKF